MGDHGGPRAAKTGGGEPQKKDQGKFNFEGRGREVTSSVSVLNSHMMSEKTTSAWSVQLSCAGVHCGSNHGLCTVFVNTCAL